MTDASPKKHAVFSFYNTPSGLFKWWDEFPQELTQKLANKSIAHHCYYRDFTPNSVYDLAQQNKVKPNSWHWLYTVYKQAKQYDHVVFHTHSFYPPLKLFLLTLFHKKYQWIITEHRLGSTPAPLWKKNLRILLRHLKIGPAYVICVSDAVEIRNKHLYGGNTKRIHNGINLKSCSNNKQKQTPKKALYVGRLTPTKGIWNLIYAFKIISQKYSDSQVELCVVGGGKLLSTLKNYVQENQLADYITFVGYQENPENYYQQADFLIVPTIIKEACSLVALEARSMGVPILYANDGGLPEAVDKAGMALQGTSPELIADSIIDLISNEENYQKMLQSCHDGLTYFSIDRMTNEYVDFYEKLLTP